MKSHIKKNKLLNKIIFSIGYFIFLITGLTFKISFKSFLNLYIYTNGSFLETFYNRYLKKDINTKSTSSKIFGNFTVNNFEKLNIELNDEGYCVFEKKLNNDLIKKLEALSLRLKANVNSQKICFNENKLISNIYKFNSEDLLNDSVVQDLIMDPLLINVARNYFKSEPIFDYPAMWWSTDYKVKIDDAAQDYHFDMDRIKWLKVFIYLSDVNDKNGPHSYISGSHRENAKPQNSLEKGYVRIEDSELEKYYSKNRFKEIKGEKGTIVFGDTLCWHKGKPITEGNRLVLQFQYTSSLFGIIKTQSVSKNSEKFFKFCNENPVFSKNLKFR